MKYIYLLTLLLISSVGFSQTKGIAYQAVILNPIETELPGVDHANAPLANTAICLKFGIIDQNSVIEYLETIQTTTDEFGMVNLIIGSGTKIGGYASTFSDIVWSSDAKNLQVHLNTKGTCDSYVEISNQPFTYVPFALYALNKNLADGTIYLGDANGESQKVTISGDVTISNIGVTTIGASKVVSSMIADGTIVVGDLANDAVETAKIKDANVTTAKLADSNVTNEKLAVGIDAAKFADGTVSNDELQYIGTLRSNAQNQIDTTTSTVATNLANTTASIAAVQSDVDANEAAANAAIATVQSDVDANEAAANAAIATVQSDVDANEAAANAAIAAVQSDVDANESAANAAIAAVQSDVDANEAAANAAIATVQSDVDANEAAANAAIAAVQSDVDANESAANAAIATVQSDVDANEAAANAADAALQSQIDTLNTTASANLANTTAAIAAVQSDVDANEAAANAAIATVQSDVDANESATNTAIASNASNINTNAAAIALNTAKTGITSSQAAAITANTAGISTNATNIAALETLADGKIYLGNSSSVATEVAMSGDVTINNAGVATIGASKVVSSMVTDGTIIDADINVSAAIADTKLATIATAGKVSNSATTATTANTPNTMVLRDGSGNFTATNVSGIVSVTNGGTGAATLTGYVKANGTSTMTASATIPVADVSGAAPLASPSFTGAVSINGSGTPDASSALDVSSTTKGFLPPRMTQQQRDSISSPAAGLIVWCTDCGTNGEVEVYNGNSWTNMIGTAAALPALPALPGNITLSAISPYFVLSVYDQDYIPYNAPTVAASIATAQAADGTNDATTLNIQGSLTTTGVTLKIPYTVVTSTVSLPAFSKTINVPASYTQDGVARDVTFSYAAATLAVGRGTINATLQAAGGTLNTKKLDLQTGIGNDGLGWLLAQFTYATNSSGGTANFDFRNIAPIPDRNIADAAHVMFYVPVSGLDGKIWLNNNLGADYANITNASFNPAAQATSSNDQNAYGSLFQWGRYSDGHELLNWTSSSAGTAVNGTTTGQSSSTTPGSGFITGSSSWNWYNGTNPDALWQGASGTNNPCPIGYRLPTETELDNLRLSWASNTAAAAFASPLKLPMAGRRNSSNGQLFNVGTNASFWSSTVDSTVSNNSKWVFWSSTPFMGSYARGYGVSVRCLKD